MADEEERVSILARFIDRVSRPARTAAKSVDELGDEANQTALELATMGEAADEAGDKTAKMGAKTKASTATQAKHRKEIDAGNRSIWARIRAYTGMTRATDKNTRATNRASAAQNRFNRSLSRGLRFLMKWTVVLALVTTALSLLGSTLYGLSAATYAGIAGLTPLLGLLIAYPAAIGSVVQSISTLKMATSGIGDAIKVLTDPKATAKEVAEATKNMSMNQVRFARAISEQNKTWKSIKRNVQDAFWKGMANNVRELSYQYLPILNKQLTNNARNWNKLMHFNSRWLKSTSGRDSITKNLKLNNALLFRFGRGFSRIFQTISLLLNSADPMLRRMGKDFDAWTTRLKRNTEGNQNGLMEFFDNAYDRAKAVGSFLADLTVGLINIGKASSGLSGGIGGDLATLAEDLRSWSGSAKGQKKIRKFFDDALPIVRETAKWIPALLGAIGIIIGGTGAGNDFVATSKFLRTKVLPEVAEFIHWFASNTFDLTKALASGVQAFNNAPGWFKGATGVVLGVLSLVGLMKKLPGAGTLANGKGGIVDNLFGMKVTVINTTPIPVTVVGAGGLGGGVGGGPGKHKGSKKGFGLGFNLPTALALTLGIPTASEQIGALKDLPGYFKQNDAVKGADPKTIYKRLMETNIGKNAEEFGIDIERLAKDMSQFGSMGPYVEQVRQSLKDWKSFKSVLGDVLPFWQSSDNRKGDALSALRDVGTEVDKRRKKDRNKLGVSGQSAWNELLLGGTGMNTGLTPKQKAWSGLKDFTLPNAKGDVQKIREGLYQANISAGQIGRTLNRINNSKIDVRIGVSMNSALGALVGGIDGAMYTGGSTQPGKSYLTGELGPEAWVSRSGKIRMLGLNGPEVVNPGSGAVLPSSFTTGGKNAGDAPSWAQEAYEKAVAGNSAVMTQRARAKAGEGNSQPISVSMPVQVHNVNSELDVEVALRKSWRKIQREWEERS